MLTTTKHFYNTYSMMWHTSQTNVETPTRYTTVSPCFCMSTNTVHTTTILQHTLTSKASNHTQTARLLVYYTTGSKTTHKRTHFGEYLNKTSQKMCSEAHIHVCLYAGTVCFYTWVLYSNQPYNIIWCANQQQ